MNKTKVENEIKEIEDMIKIYKRNGISNRIYFPIQFRLNYLKNKYTESLPKISLQCDKVIIDINNK